MTMGMSQQNVPTGGRGLVSLRVSDAKQDLAEQRLVVQNWLDRHGLSGNVVEWFSDVGSRMEAYARPGFQAMLKRVERGDVDWVAVECLDRFGVRSSAELGKFVCHLQDNNVKLYCISENLEATSEDAFTTLSTTISGLRSTDELRARAHRSLKGKVKQFRNGEHGGGPPPYGYATICLDSLDIELWRLEYLGPDQGVDQRVQIFPDGKRVPFTGPNNTPRKNQGETLRIAPSLYTERHEWVRKIFEWYTTEIISAMAIATRLNNLGVDALNGKGWSGPRVKKMLCNPAYALGRAVGNKSGRGKLLGLARGSGGSPSSTGDDWVETPIKRINGRIGVIQRDYTDYIYPDQAGGQGGEPLISQETWQLAFAKFQGRKTRARCPRNGNTWLSGLLVCDKCNNKMAGLNRDHGREKHNYCCAHHRRYGVASPCRHNRVAHSFLERLVDEYLEEAGIKLDKIAHDPLKALRALTLVQWSRSKAYLGTLEEMTKVLQAAGVVTREEIDGNDYDCCDLRAEYRRLHEDGHAELAAQIKTREEQLRGFILNIPRLTSKLAIEMAEQEVDRLGQELAELKSQTEDLDVRASHLREAIIDASERLREAREALAGSEALKKGEAVRKVIRAIRLTFEPVANPGTHEPTSRLVKVVIEPLEGDSLVVNYGSDETEPHPGFQRHHLLARVYLPPWEWAMGH